MQSENPDKILSFDCHLKNILETHSMYQSQLRQITGLSTGTVRQLMRGNTVERIDKGTSQKILLALDCQFYELWNVGWGEEFVRLAVPNGLTLKFNCQLSGLLEGTGMNQKDLSRLTGLSTGTIGTLYGGADVKRIDRGTSEKILQALDCRFDRLWQISWSD
ncbi:helix-turn-helix domain-containing protein [Chamaesiphon sp.]|uniref:helix-turn-helix domain-containing protein n=1 Tax=Chamaesiphon sp. TaxID=2814140 RepID=UPI003593AE77